MRVVGNKESEGSKAMVMAMATKRADKWSVTAMKRAMVTAMRVVDKR